MRSGHSHVTIDPAVIDGVVELLTGEAPGAAEDDLGPEARAARRMGRVAQARQWIGVVEHHDHPPLAPYAAPGGVPLTLLGVGRRLMIDLLDELDPTDTCRGPDGSATCTRPRFHEGECDRR